MAEQDSNLRPGDYESLALTAELSALVGGDSTAQDCEGENGNEVHRPDLKGTLRPLQKIRLPTSVKPVRSPLFLRHESARITRVV